jgi:hypothetical protein
LEPFKSRLFSVEGFGMKFKAGEGFIPNGRLIAQESQGPDPLEVVTKIIRDNSGLDQKGVVELAGKQGISKHSAEEALKSAAFEVRKGKGRAKLYYLREVQADREQAA